MPARTFRGSSTPFFAPYPDIRILQFLFDQGLKTESSFIEIVFSSLGHLEHDKEINGAIAPHCLNLENSQKKFECLLLFVEKGLKWDFNSIENISMSLWWLLAENFDWFILVTEGFGNSDF